MSGKLGLSQRAAWAEGQPISDLMSRALANPELVSLAAGFVDQDTLPAELTRQALENVFADDAQARGTLQYGTTPGYGPLREIILSQLREADGQPAAEENLSVDQVVVTAGSNQLLHLVSESLCDPGDIVLCASPTYLVYLGTLGNIGARAIGVATDTSGMIPDALERRLQRIDAAGQLALVKAIYLVTYFDNPCGITLPVDRRQQIVEIAKRWSRGGRIHVIEDAAYRQLRYAGEDLPSMRCFDPEGNTVVVAGTYSKSYSPGIRVGWGILTPDLVSPVCNQKGNIDFGSPNFSQHLMAQVLKLGLFGAHVENIRSSYRQKLDTMLRAAETLLAPIDGVRWIEPSGGLYVWVELPESIDTGPAGRLFDRAVELGVLYVPGQFCFPAEGEPVRNNTLRLSFGVQTCEKIQQGMQSLAQAIEQTLGESG